MPESSTQPLILFAGATARWACQSGQAAGARCIAADLFGDLDTRKAAESTLVLSDFSELPKLAVDCRPDAVVLLGGLENHPVIVQQIAETIEILGCPADSLEKCLDPMFLKNILGEHFPTTRSKLPPRVRPQQWLMKPVRSAGGQGVRLVRSGTATRASDRFVFQEFIPGPTFGAVFVCCGGDVILLGMTRQLAGTPFHSSRFAYCGSIGPIPIAPDLSATLSALANKLAANLDIRGLFGLDFIVDPNRPAPIVVVDVNLRPTASCEILQMDLGARLNLIQLHLAAARGNAGDSIFHRVPSVPSGDTLFGKAIVYWGAEQRDEPSNVERDAFKKLESELGRNVADIPSGPMMREAGKPIVTVLTEGNGFEQVLNKLKAARNSVFRILATRKTGNNRGKN